MKYCRVHDTFLQGLFANCIIIVPILKHSNAMQTPETMARAAKTHINTPISNAKIRYNIHVTYFISVFYMSECSKKELDDS